MVGLEFQGEEISGILAPLSRLSSASTLQPREYFAARPPVQRLGRADFVKSD